MHNLHSQNKAYHSNNVNSIHHLSKKVQPVLKNHLLRNFGKIIAANSAQNCTFEYVNALTKIMTKKFEGDLQWLGEAKIMHATGDRSN